jgi:hypothetical protein
MAPSVKTTAQLTNAPTSTSDVCGSPRLILEVRPVHETSTKLSRGIEDPHAEMLILPMRVSLESQWESRGNNKQQHAEASNENECEHSKVLTGNLQSFPKTSKHTRKSSFPLDYEVFNESAKVYFPIEHKMDLNRELPPLPIPNPIIPLRIRKTSMSAAEPEPERLLQLRYNPARDGLKYGGIQYHPEGIRYWPEVSQYQLRTSPMSAADTCTKSSSRPIHIESETSKFSKTRAEVKCAPMVSEHHHEVSTGIMGNFMPLAPSGPSLHSGTESERTPLTR